MPAEEDYELLVNRLERVSPMLSALFAPFFAEIKAATQYAIALGVTNPIILHPLLLDKYEHFKDGVCFEVIRLRKQKRTDVIASGGRYAAILFLWFLNTNPTSDMTV